MKEVRREYQHQVSQFRDGSIGKVKLEQVESRVRVWVCKGQESAEVSVTAAHRTPDVILLLVLNTVLSLRLDFFSKGTKEFIFKSIRVHSLCACFSVSHCGWDLVYCKVLICTMCCNMGLFSVKSSFSKDSYFLNLPKSPTLYFIINTISLFRSPLSITDGWL